MNNRLDATTAVKDTLPTVFGYIGIGLAFGIVARASGINPLLVLLMSRSACWLHIVPSYRLFFLSFWLTRA